MWRNSTAQTTLAFTLVSNWIPVLSPARFEVVFLDKVIRSPLCSRRILFASSPRPSSTRFLPLLCSFLNLTRFFHILWEEVTITSSQHPRQLHRISGFKVFLRISGISYSPPPPPPPCTRWEKDGGELCYIPFENFAGIFKEALLV